MFNLILFGPPGSGKGTQSEKLIEKFGWIHLSTGDLLRKEIANATQLGLEAKAFMDKGQLVPDEVVIGMIGSALDANPTAKGFLFDGFPRTEAQAEALDSLLASKGSEITLVLALEVGQEELVARLLNRGKTSARSDDRDENVIRKRLVEYADKTAIVADYYAKFGKVAKVKGEGSIEEIFQSLCAKIEAKQPA
jgi:adenylate kinase